MTGAQIRKWREARGWSLDRLAAALGVDRMTVWRWEQPRRSPHSRQSPPFLELALKALEADDVAD